MNTKSDRPLYKTLRKSDLLHKELQGAFGGRFGGVGGSRVDVLAGYLLEVISLRCFHFYFIFLTLSEISCS